MHIALYKSLPYQFKNSFQYNIVLINYNSFRMSEAFNRDFSYMDPSFRNDLMIYDPMTVTDGYSRAYRFYHLFGTHPGADWDENLEGAADAEAVGRAVVATLWDAQADRWADSFDAARGARRPHEPLYGLFHVSAFARDLAPGDPAACAARLKDAFLMGDRLAMFPWRTTAHLADGNQYGSYYPVTDRTYWNAQNAAGRTDALADFRRIVGRHARVLTYPEGQTADVVNADPSDGSDELGNKQFFAAKGWLADALDLWLGLRLSRDGISLRPMNDGRPFAVRGLAVRGATLDVEMTGVGTNAACELNGGPLPRAFLPWSAIRPGRNALRIRLLPLAP